MKLDKKFISNLLLLKKNYIIYLVGALLIALLKLSIIPLFTYQLPKSEFGIIGILWLVMPVLSSIINLGCNNSFYILFGKADYKERCSLVYNTFCILLANGLFIFLIFYINLDWLKYLLDNMDSRTFIMLYFMIFSSIIMNMFFNILTFENKAVLHILFMLLNVFLTAVFTFILILYVQKSYHSYIMAMLIANVLVAIIGVKYMIKNYSYRQAILSYKTTKKLVYLGTPIIFIAIGIILLSAGDRYVIKHFIGLEAVAIYTFAYIMAERFNQFLFQPFTKAFTPVAFEKAKQDIDAFKSYFRAMIDKTVVGFTLFLALILIPMKAIMSMLGGDAYSGSYTIFIIAFFGIVIMYISQLIALLINYYEKTRYNMILVIISAIVNLLLNIYFIPKYGIIAAAWTTVFSYLLMMCLRFYFLFYKINFHFNIKNVLFYLFLFALYMLINYQLTTLIEAINKPVGYLLLSINFILYAGFIFYFSKYIKHTFTKYLKLKFLE